MAIMIIMMTVTSMIIMMNVTSMMNKKNMKNMMIIMIMLIMMIMFFMIIQMDKALAPGSQGSWRALDFLKKSKVNKSCKVFFF